MRVDAVMTKTVVTIRADATILAAIAKLVDHKISGLPVVNDLGRLIGMITEGDLLRRIELGTHRQPPSWLGFLRTRERTARDYVHDHTQRVGDIMTRDPAAVEAETPLDQVVALMESMGIRRMPVLANGGLIGIVSRGDLVRALGEVLREKASARRLDVDILHDVLAELRGQAWFKACKVTVDVQAGTVSFKGTVRDDVSESALRAAADSVRGVIAVRMAVAVGA